MKNSDLGFGRRQDLALQYFIERIDMRNERSNIAVLALTKDRVGCNGVSIADNGGIWRAREASNALQHCTHPL